jgi:hypothetical protein
LENIYVINEEGDILFNNWEKNDIDIQALLYGVPRPNLEDVLENLYFCGRTESGLTDVFIYDEGWVIAFPLFHCRHQYLTKNVSYVRDNLCRVECSKYRKYVRWTRVKDVGCACANCIGEKRTDMSKEKIQELFNLYTEAEEEDTEGCQIASRFRLCDIGKSAYPNLLDHNDYEHPNRYDLGKSFIGLNLRRNLKYDILHTEDGVSVWVIGIKGVLNKQVNKNEKIMIVDGGIILDRIWDFVESEEDIEGYKRVGENIFNTNRINGVKNSSMSKLSVHKPSLDELVDKYFDTGYLFGYDINTFCDGNTVKVKRNPLNLKDLTVTKEEKVAITSRSYFDSSIGMFKKVKLNTKNTTYDVNNKIISNKGFHKRNNEQCVCKIDCSCSDCCNNVIFCDNCIKNSDDEVSSNMTTKHHKLKNLVI